MDYVPIQVLTHKSDHASNAMWGRKPFSFFNPFVLMSLHSTFFSYTILNICLFKIYSTFLCRSQKNEMKNWLNFHIFFIIHLSSTHVTLLPIIWSASNVYVHMITVFRITSIFRWWIKKIVYFYFLNIFIRTNELTYFVHISIHQSMIICNLWQYRYFAYNLIRSFVAMDVIILLLIKRKKSTISPFDILFWKSFLIFLL